MNDLTPQGNETIGLLMAFLVLLAVSSLLTLWILKPLSDENADEDTRQRAYETALLSFGAFMPSYFPVILACNPQNTEKAEDQSIDRPPQLNPNDVDDYSHAGFSSLSRNAGTYAVAQTRVE